MNNENNKNFNKNAFNNLNQFLHLLLFAELYMIILSIVQMIFENRDISPQIAAINTVLFILTINYIRKKSE